MFVYSRKRKKSEEIRFQEGISRYIVAMSDTKGQKRSDPILIDDDEDATQPPSRISRTEATHDLQAYAKDVSTVAAAVATTSYSTPFSREKKDEKSAEIYVGLLCTRKEMIQLLKRFGMDEIRAKRVVKASMLFTYFYELLEFERRMFFEYNITTSDYFKDNGGHCVSELKKQCEILSDLEGTMGKEDIAIIFCPHHNVTYVKLTRDVFDGPELLDVDPIYIHTVDGSGSVLPVYNTPMQRLVSDIPK